MNQEQDQAAQRQQPTILQAINTLTTKLDNLEAKVDDLIDDLGTKIDNLEAKVDEIDDDLGTKVDNLKAKADDIDDDLRTKVENLEAKVDNLIDELRTEVDNVEAKVDNVEAKVDDLDDDLGTKVDNLSKQLGYYDNNQQARIQNSTSARPSTELEALVNVETGVEIAGFPKNVREAHNANAALVNQILRDLNLSTAGEFNVKKVRMMVAIGL
ncbi:hypothetical protein QQX98_013127 [Neonectria punicea]|uniref:t-SNARE coiled-coil homology domain-containing protein n=1 Tax=Neonectria punicea TaxID=979145 RepID=A0ABR1GGY3_9HYPO